MCESRGDHMPRNQGNKVAPVAELGDGFDLAAALRVGLVPLVVMAEAPGIGYGNADCRVFFWRTRGGSEVDFVLYGPFAAARRPARHQDVPPRLPGGGAAAAVPGQRDPGAGRCEVHAGRPLPARAGAGPRPAALTAALGVEAFHAAPGCLNLPDPAVAWLPAHVHSDGGIITHRRLASSGRGRQAYQIASGVGCLEGGDVASGAAELDADEVDRLARGAVLVGVAALLQLGEGQTGRVGTNGFCVLCAENRA